MRHVVHFYYLTVVNQDNRGYSQLNTHLLLCLKPWFAHCIPHKIKLNVLCVSTDNKPRTAERWWDDLFILNLWRGSLWVIISWRMNRYVYMYILFDWFSLKNAVSPFCDSMKIFVSYKILYFRILRSPVFGLAHSELEQKTDCPLFCSFNR